VRKSKKRKSATPKKVKRVLVIALSVWLGVVVIYRFVAPPLTPLMLIRRFQAAWDDRRTAASWEWVSLRSLPAYVPQAIVTAEDARFIEHWGIDIGAVSDALSTSNDSSRVRGASTITMQTVKNLFLWPGRSYIRKGFEWVMSPIAGLVWGKRRTLELYINIIEWGDGIYGLQSAAKHYFKINASQLSRSQAAALASILPNPRKLSPIHMVRSTERRYERILRESSSAKLP